MNKENKNQITRGLRMIFSYPIIYNAFQRIVGINRIYNELVKKIIMPGEQVNVLDIGCGDGYILDFLPRNTIYVGYDISPAYIDFAKKKYKERGTFYNQSVNELTIDDGDLYDIVLVIGLLHHLDEQEGREVFRLGYDHLKKDGLMVSVDNCYFEGQSPIARFISSMDRGKNVRYPEGYEKLASKSFKNIQTIIRHNLGRIPQTLCILECRKENILIQ